VVDVVLVVACDCQSDHPETDCEIHTQVEVVVLCVAEGDECADDVNERCMLR